MEAVFHRLLLDENPDAAILTSPTGEVVFWNKGAESIFGFSSAEVVGGLLANITIPSDRLAEHVQLLAETMQSGCASCETLRHKKDGSLVYVDITWKAIRSAQGPVQYILLVQKDVTDLKVRAP